MSAGAIRHGRCLCGAVSWQAVGAPLWQRFCHCDSCRRNCAAPVAAFIAFPEDAVTWPGEAPARYVSSPGVTRSFCARCGTPIAYRNAELPGEVHLYAAALDNPHDFAPEGHDFWSERLGWLHLSDDLPKDD
jgi:hypothetical protein